MSDEENSRLTSMVAKVMVLNAQNNKYFFYNLKSFHVKSNSEIPFYNFQLTILFFRNQSVLILVCRGVLDVVISTDYARFSCSFKGWCYLKVLTNKAQSNIIVGATSCDRSFAWLANVV